MSDILKFSIIISLIILGIAIIVLCVTISKKRNQIVKDNSEMLQKLKSLNAKTHFYDNIQPSYDVEYNFETKRKYDNTSVKSFFYSEVASNLNWYKSLIKIVNTNRNLYHDYIVEYNSLKSTATPENVKPLKISYKSFISREQKIYQNNRLHVINDISFYCKLSYISPQGRNHYSKDEVYNIDYLQNLINKILQDISYRKTEEYRKKMERLKMSDSLRYDVMMRDGFKCVICGASAKDGAKLHVDHIIPISKGGKTELDNLRTLCDRCNLGKSDKIEIVNKE